MIFNRTHIYQSSTSLITLLFFLLSACGGGGGGSGWGPAGAAADTAAPITTNAPAVSGTSATATILSVAIDENGTGYYLMLPASAPPPTVAEVQTGVAIAMSANVAATRTISGLAPNTAYMIYFVAKDAAGNVQKTALSVPVTTSEADTTAPLTTLAPSVPIYSSNSAFLTATINENGTGFFLVRPTTAADPAIAEVLAGTPFAMTADVAANPTITGLTSNTAYYIYFVAKDASNNVQAAVQKVQVTTLSPGYIVQGGLTWMPVTFFDTWTSANTYCTSNTIGGITGWRMPTQPELSELAKSGAIIGQGWAMNSAWSSTEYFNPETHYFVSLSNGVFNWFVNSDYYYVSCVHQ